MSYNKSLSDQIGRDIEESAQIKQELKAYEGLISEFQVYKTAAFRLAKTNDELLEQLAEANADAERLYGVVNNEISDPDAYINIVRAKHRARVGEGG